MTPDDRMPHPERSAADASDIDALLAGHALGDLDSAECERLAALLAQDPALRDRLGEFRTTLQLLPLALPATEAPPARLRRRLLGQARRSAEASGPATGVEPVPGREGLAGRVAVLLLGLALLGLGVQLHQTREQLARIDQRLARAAAPGTASPLSPASRQLHLVGATPGMRARGDVLVTGNGTHNVLMLDDLPPPPPGHVYRLWAEVDGRRVGCVSFVPTEQGHVGMLIPTAPTSRARTVSVSVEPDPMGTAPTGPTVLTSTL
jgi:anti-sigma-K factor RskA